MEKETRRRHIIIEIPKREKEALFATVSSDEVFLFKDAEHSQPIDVKGKVVLDIEIPFKIKNFTVIRSGLAPVIELGINRKLWPMKNMVDVRLIFDNRNISMVDKTGEFREAKYKVICNALYWKKWCMLVYKTSEGNYESTLFWKP